MANKNIAVQGCTLTLSPGTGTATISTSPSNSVKIDNKGAYFGVLTINISAYTGTTITVPASGSGTGTLSPTAQKCKSQNMAAVLEGDKATIVVNGQAYSGTTTIPAVESVTVTIQSAGQTKVKAA